MATPTRCVMSWQTSRAMCSSHCTSRDVIIIDDVKLDLFCEFKKIESDIICSVIYVDIPDVGTVFNLNHIFSIFCK